MVRRAFAVIITAFIGVGAVASDIVIKRDGRKLTGKLKSCIGSRCQLDAQSIPRDTIAWIGLTSKSSTPPAVVDRYKDEVHLIDGRVESGALLNLTLGDVVTEMSNFKRADVVWIHFVPPNTNEGPVIDDSGAEPAPAPAPSPAPAPAPPTPQPKPRTPAPPSRPPAPTPKPPVPPKAQTGVMKQCPADNPMGGLVTFVAQYNRGRDNCFETVRTTLRFPLVPFWHSMNEKWPVLVSLGFNESKIEYEISSTGCSGTTPNGEEQCRADAGRRSGTWIRTPLTTALPAIYFSAVKPGIEANQLPGDIAVAYSVPFECKGPRSGGKSTYGVGLGGFAVRDLGEANCAHADEMGAETKSRVFCAIRSGECSRPDGLPGSECILHADRHATFPFFGESSWKSDNTNDELVSTNIRWDICCGCAAKAAPPDFTPHEQPSTNCVEEIAALRGKKKGLEDAADIDRKDLAKKTNDASVAGKKIFGTNGGLFKLSNATIGVLSKLGDSKLAQLAGLAAAVVSQQQAEGATDQALANLGVAAEVGEGQVELTAQENAFNQAITEYVNDYLATGNEEAARKAFEEEFEHALGGAENTATGLKVVAAILALRDFYEAGGEFTEQVSEYSEAGDEAKEAEEQLDQTEEHINDLDVEIQTLLRNCPDAPAEGNESFIDVASAIGLASMMTDAAPTAAGGDATHALKAKTDQLKAMNDKSQQRISRSILPYLVPFITGKWRGMDRRVLLFLVRSVNPQLRALLAEVQQEGAVAQQVIALAKTVEAAGPSPSKAEFDRRDPLPSSGADRLRRAIDQLFGR
jgi:hypothetical protein